MTTGKALNGKPCAGNPHVRFDEGEDASAATPRRGSLLYRIVVCGLMTCVGMCASAQIIYKHTYFRRMVFVFALLTAIVGVAVEVPREKACLAVNNWLARNNSEFFEFSGKQVLTSRSFAGKDGTIRFHAMELDGGGFVVTSADTMISPIIAFSDSGSFCNANDDNPLHAMLMADLTNRRKILNERIDRGASNVTTKSQKRLTNFSMQMKEEKEWDELTKEYNTQRRLTARDTTFVDIRVPPLLQTSWAQRGEWTDGNGEKQFTFNRYTPGNASCGCTATAYMQLMRYWEWPDENHPIVPFRTKCSYNGEEREMTAFGGTYAWSIMPDSDRNVTSVEQCEALGKIAYDVGVCARMGWSDDGSGASISTAAQGLKTYFGYASAGVANVGTHGGPIEKTPYADLIFGALDARMPSVLHIEHEDETGSPISGGHSVVADGYGYLGETIYCHVNFGWRGLANAWYNLIINDDFGYGFIANCSKNIHPTETGSVLSGRVLDENGVAVSNADVIITKPDGTIQTVEASQLGIYHFRINEGGVYIVSAIKDGKKTGEGRYVEMSAEDNVRNQDLTLLATPPESLVISGVTSVTSGEIAQFEVQGTWQDGTMRPIPVMWDIVSGADAADIEPLTGVLVSHFVSGRDKTATVRAQYVFNGLPMTAEVSVVVRALPHGTPYFLVRDGTLKAVELNGCSDIVMPQSVTMIGDGVFSNCTELASVELPDGLKFIGEYAFAWCSSLKSIVIPEGALQIGRWAFYYCTGLESVKLPQGLKSTPYKGFMGCGNLKRVTIPELVTTISGWSFCQSGLTEVILSTNVNSFETGGFQNCSALRRAYVPKQLETMISDRDVFGGCSNVAIYYYEDSLGHIVFDANGGEGEMRAQPFARNVMQPLADNTFARRGYVFAGWATSPNGDIVYADGEDVILDVDIVLYAKWQQCYYVAFDANGGYGEMTPLTCLIGNDVVLTSNAFAKVHHRMIGWSLYRNGPVIYKDGATVLPNMDMMLYAVWESADMLWTIDSRGVLTGVDLNGLVDAVIPSNVISIAASAFRGNAELKSVVMGGSVKTLASSALRECVGLSDVTLSTNLTEIASYAFNDCTNLLSIVIPDGVTLIGGGAFRGCINLERVKIGKSVTKIGDRAFHKCAKLVSVALPDRIADIGYLSFRWCYDMTNITIGSSLTNIADRAFEGCSKLKSVVFRGNAPSLGGSEVFAQVPMSCTVYVNRNSTGWGVEIPGTWNGMRIEYMAEEVEIDVGGGKRVAVPQTWLDEHPEFVARANGDRVAALGANAANGRLSVVECYVLGLNPELATDDFRITSFPMKTDGTLDLAGITFTPAKEDWNVPDATPVLKGAATLEDEWQMVTDENKGAFRFFKVVVELP